MKIRVSLVERHYGYIDIDVPEDSPILNPNASLLKKRRAAKKLAEHEITEGDGIYVIDADACVDCGTCAENCPVDAPVEA